MNPLCNKKQAKSSRNNNSGLIGFCREMRLSKQQHGSHPKGALECGSEASAFLSLLLSLKAAAALPHSKGFASEILPMWFCTRFATETNQRTAFSQ
jgi:hypothetical protein